MQRQKLCLAPRTRCQSQTRHPSALLMPLRTVHDALNPLLPSFPPDWWYPLGKPFALLLPVVTRGAKTAVSHTACRDGVGSACSAAVGGKGGQVGNWVRRNGLALSCTAL
jgi:hypothetical protein